MIRPYPENGQYLVSDKGFVWSTLKGNPVVIGRYATPDGYFQTSIMVGGKSVKRLIHRMILETFISSRPDGMQCRHLDGNKRNNHISNLKWGTHSENANDMHRHGYQSPCGEDASNVVLTEKQVVEIKRLLMYGELSRQEIADIYGVSYGAIYKISTGYNWKHVSLDSALLGTS